MRFEDLDLNDNVLDALYDMRFDTCTPVQEKCIPEILKGRDVLGVAQTGTGKTAAYLLPILSKLDDGGYPKDTINCVVMCPTRELAQQIDQAMQGFGYYIDGVSSLAIYGGNDGNRYDQEMKSLQLGADVIIATPGRLLSHISMGNANFSRVSFFVLDEADRMLDMGFFDDIMKIARLLPKDCQTTMFSATMPEKIEELARTLLKDPVEVKIAVSKPADKIKQSAYVCYETQKLGIIKDMFKRGNLKRVIIFSGKKQKVKAINRALQQLHINSGEMHSDLDQAQRNEMLHNFKTGQIDVLVATDIVARGIDIDDIVMVVNFDVPLDSEDYVHRVGRTARADHDGVAVTFISDAEIGYFMQIEKLLGKEVTKTPLPDGLGEAPDYKLKGGHGNGRARSTNKGRDAHDNGRRKAHDNTRRNNGRRHNTNQSIGDGNQQKSSSVNDAIDSKLQSVGNNENKDNNRSRQSTHKSRRNGRNVSSTDVKNNGQRQNASRQNGNGGQKRQARHADKISSADGARHADREHKRGKQENARDSNNRMRRQNSGGIKPKKNSPTSQIVDKKIVATVENKKETGVVSLFKKSIKWIKSIGKDK